MRITPELLLELPPEPGSSPFQDSKHPRQCRGVDRQFDGHPAAARYRALDPSHLRRTGMPGWRQLLRHTGRRYAYRQKPAAGPLAELPALGEHLIGTDVMTPGNHRDRSPRLVGLCHDPELLRRAPAPPRATVGNRTAASRSGLLRINQHLRSCPHTPSWTLSKMMDTQALSLARIGSPRRRLTDVRRFQTFSCCHSLMQRIGDAVARLVRSDPSLDSAYHATSRIAIPDRKNSVNRP